jgi:predicted ATPase
MFIKRVRLRNYKSIADCDVRLSSLTFLVGANGAGKSNFIDALRLVSDSLATPLDHALRERGGIGEVRRRSAGHPTHFSIRVDLELPGTGAQGFYAFEVGAQRGSFAVTHEQCEFEGAHYYVESGHVKNASAEVMPPASSDRLYLTNAAGLPTFRPIFDALSRMGFYNLNPDIMRELQDPDAGEVLRRDGGNLTSVVQRLWKDDVRHKRIVELLAAVVPGVVDVDVRRLGHKETLEFHQRVENQKRPLSFPALAMSDGTLRAFGVLVALFQEDAKGPIPFVAIEEPEVALHPAAAGVLVDALRASSKRSQILVTSHSPDLLDDEDLQPDELRAVVARDGRTEIAPVDSTTAEALARHLHTAGELLRLDQLMVDEKAIEDSRNQLNLFEPDSHP